MPAGFPLFRPSNITSGLVGYWKLDEASGNRADSSGNGNTLTDNNTVASVAQDYWKTGENSADFESGNSESLSRTNASQVGLGLTSTYSFSTWVKFESVVDGMTLVGKWVSSTGYQLRVRTSGHLEVVHNSTLYTSSSGISVGKWTHIGLVYDDTNNLISFYIDGNLNYSVAATTNPSSNSTDFRLGVSGATTDYYDGLLKDAALWNVALTPIQIKSLALGVDLSTYAYRPNNVSTQPTAWWKLNEISSGGGAVTRNDSIGSLHLTDTNTVTTSNGYIEGAGASFASASSEYLTIADNTAFDFSGGIFSISAWIRITSLASNRYFYMQSTDASNFFRVGVLATGAVEVNCFSGGSSVVDVETAASTIKTSTWHHIAVTENGNTWKIYVDGVDATSVGGTDTSRCANFTGNLDIGRLVGGTNYWEGQISDLAIWKGYTLTAAEVASLACAIPLQQTGLVSYWKLDETSGNRADSIGSNTLTDNNTVLSGAGKVSNAADFEASNSEFLSVADNSDLRLTTDFAFCFWFKMESNGSAQYLVDKDSAVDGWGAYITAGNVFRMDIASASLSGTTSISTGTWYHGVGMWDGATRKIYINSAVENSFASTTAPSDATESVRIGAYKTPSYYFDGLMDEVPISKRWFREEEIKTIYCKGLAGKELTSSEIQLGGNQVIWFL